MRKRIKLQAKKTPLKSGGVNRGLHMKCVFIIIKFLSFLWDLIMT